MPVILGVSIENIRQLRGMGIRTAAVLKSTLRETAEKWHDDLMDSHFTPGNNSRYDLAPRSQLYLDEIKKKYGQGQGRWVLLKLSEKSQRWMGVFVNYSGTSKQVTVSMRPPTYFTNPFVGRWVDRDGKIKQVTQQPNKPAEVAQVNNADRGTLRDFMAERIRAKAKTIVTG